MNRIDIKIGFNCNNACAFCVQGDKRHKFKNKTLAEIKSALDQAKAEGITGVVFTGGEPTIHPNILDVARYARDLGFGSIQVQSNGRMFAYMDFCKQLISAGVNEFSPALHGSQPELHDELTKSPGAWQQVVQGIKNLKSLGQYVLTNTVINSKNYQNLPDLAQLFIDLDVDQFQFAFVHILGTADKNKDWLVPKMNQVMPYVKKGLDIGTRAGKVVMTEAIPYCLMDGYEGYIAEKIMPETKIVDAEGVIADFSAYRLTKGKAKREECKACKFFKICEGPWKEYPEIFGWQEFEPVLEGLENFRALGDKDFKFIELLKENYNLENLISIYEYKGHSCHNLQLLEFPEQKLVVKFTNYAPATIWQEKELIEGLKDFNFPKLLLTKQGEPFFKYNGKLVKVYEFIDGKKSNLSEHLELVTTFVKYSLNNSKIFKDKSEAISEFQKAIKTASQDIKLQKFNELFLKNKIILDLYFENNDEIILYHPLELLQDNTGKVHVLESEHLTEHYYPVLSAIAKYLADVLEEGKILDANKLINPIIEGSGLKIDKQTSLLLRIFLAAELINRLIEMEDSRFYHYFDLVVG